MKKIFLKILACSFALVIPLTAFLITTNQKNVSASSIYSPNGTSFMNIFSDCDIYFNYSLNKTWFSNTSYEYTENLTGSINSHVGGFLYSNNNINNYIAKIEHRTVIEPEHIELIDYVPLCVYQSTLIEDNSVNFQLITAKSDYLRLHFNNFFIPFGNSSSGDDFYSRFFNTLYRIRFSDGFNCLFDMSINYLIGFDGSMPIYETLTVNDFMPNDFEFSLAEPFSDSYNVDDLSLPYFINYNGYNFGCFSITVEATSSNLRNFILNYINYEDLGGWYTIDDYNNLLGWYNDSISNTIYNNGYNASHDPIMPFDIVTNTVESFLNTEIFPEFKIYYFLLIAFGFALFGVVIKYAFGG